ncbi:SPOR domain-containing protein [Mucilaginibacter sp. L3T2-6]|uniref:HU domain-containing protein n=1 Tax=Mucilaginibacter sp. L3T2-6 TaxID=3062491 RepID=UPI0026765952|nr:SPOR domain-containing protein [Mucilaginibacter sp. L3T2-6]MDO3644808.1 SPOR domain-containing protein [Mucilaginibacter sp. L3T2-6]MDV6217298.1 SPOR domain-containing protein [Mucilaginibacter sp. L3T2-6]
MNLADYLSELLGQYEEVSVPGLGYFVRERVNGYYNDKEARFYPPYHRVKFVAQPKDDDTFAQYVADKKNISLASSKYFAEKFVSKLREQALTGKYIFADIGLFYTDQDQQLVFKPNDKIADDPAFYGYPQLNVYKQGQPLNEQYSRPSFANVAPAPAVLSHPVQSPQPVTDELYFEEEAERKKGVNVWLIVLIVLTAVALSVFGVYKFYPDVFDRIGSAFHVTKKADTSVPIYRRETKADTVAKSTIVPHTDTASKTAAQPVAAAPPADTVKKPSWAIIVISYRQQKFADPEIKRLKAKNIDARVLSKNEATGNRIKVAITTIYPTEAEAEAARSVLVKAGKIPATSSVLPLKQ